MDHYTGCRKEAVTAGGTSSGGMDIPKKSSVSSMASIASSLDSPYIRLMTDVLPPHRKRSSDSSSASLTSNPEIGNRKRAVSETPSHASLPEEGSEATGNKEDRPDAKKNHRLNAIGSSNNNKAQVTNANRGHNAAGKVLPLSLAKSRRLARKKEKSGPTGSKIFENYKAQILGRATNKSDNSLAKKDVKAATSVQDAHQTHSSPQLLDVPKPTLHPNKPVRRSSYNDLIKSMKVGDNGDDPDLGDSSGFTRSSLARSTWSEGKGTNAAEDKKATGSQHPHQVPLQRRTLGLKKFGKLFIGKQHS